MSRPKVPPSDIKNHFNAFPGLESILNERDQKRYPFSVVQSWQNMAQPGGKPDALAKAVSDCLAIYNPDLRSHERSLLIPISSLTTRALDATTGSQGGYVVGSQVSQDVARVLRANSVCIAAGARVLAGLRSNLAFGLELSEVAFDWYHSQDTVTSSDPSFGQLAFSAHRIAGLTSFPKELKILSNIDVQGFMIDSLSRGLGVGVDRGALVGSGALGEPQGVYYEPNIQGVTFGGAATLSKVASMQQSLLDAKGRVEDIAFVAPPGTRSKWQTIQRFASGSAALWSDDETIVGRPAYTTTSMPTGSIMAGNFSSMIIGFYGESIETVVDPYSLKTSARIELLCTAYADCGVTYPTLWIKNVDSAVQ